MEGRDKEICHPGPLLMKIQYYTTLVQLRHEISIISIVSHDHASAEVSGLGRNNLILLDIKL